MPYTERVLSCLYGINHLLYLDKYGDIKMWCNCVEEVYMDIPLIWDVQTSRCDVIVLEEVFMDIHVIWDVWTSRCDVTVSNETCTYHISLWIPAGDMYTN